jgi:hypothetical protein
VRSILGAARVPDIRTRAQQTGGELRIANLMLRRELVRVGRVGEHHLADPGFGVWSGRDAATPTSARPSATRARTTRELALTSSTATCCDP